MILVAGGTGRLGTMVVERLVDRGLEVRILTRDASRAQALAGDRVEVVVGDIRERHNLVPAVSGADIVVSAVHGFVGPRGISPASVDRDGNVNLIDAAKAAGAECVLVSTVGAAADSPMELFRMKYAAERYAATSGVPTTVVRATAFLDLWIEMLRQSGDRPLVFGEGDNSINFVSVADVAATVELAVIDSSTRGSTLEIGGPEDFTFNQLAQAVLDSAGSKRKPRHIPPMALHIMANTIGRLNPQLGRQARAALVMDGFDLTFDDAPLRRAHPELPCTTLADVLATGVSGRGGVTLPCRR